MAQEEESTLTEAIKAVKERKNELILQQKTISNLKAEIAKVEQQKAKDAKRKAELKLQIDTTLHTIEERRALRKVIDQYTSNAETVQKETWTDLTEVEEQLQTVCDGVELVQKTTEYHRDCIKKMISEFDSMKLQLTNAFTHFDAAEQQKREKKEMELAVFKEEEVQWLGLVEKEMDELKSRLADREELNRQTEACIAHRKEQLVHLRALREERLHILATKKDLTRKARAELDENANRLLEAEERVRTASERRDAAKRRLETSQARRADLLAEKLNKKQLREQRRADRDARLRELADKIEAERNAITLLTNGQSETHSEFNAIYVHEKTEFEAIRRRMTEEVAKLKAELEEDGNAAKDMQAEIAAPPTADELRASVDQLHAEIREIAELNAKLAQEEKVLEEKENLTDGLTQIDDEDRTTNTSCSRRLAMSVASPSQQSLSPMLRPLPQPSPPKRFGRVSGPAADHSPIANTAKAKKPSIANKQRRSSRLSTPKKPGRTKRVVVDSTPGRDVVSASLCNTPKSPSIMNEDTSLTSDVSDISMWSPLCMN